MRWSPLFALGLFVGSFALEAGAQPAPGAASTIAEGLFRQARELSKDGRHAEACPKFEESQRLEPKLGTLLNLALCHEAIGRTATAWTELRAAAAQAEREGQKEREQLARDKALALEKVLPYLVLSATGTPPEGLTITLDGQPLGASVLSTPIPIDPGQHTLHVAASGRAPWSSVVVIPSGHGTTPVAVPELAPAPQVPVAPPVAPTPAPAASAPPQPAALAPAPPAAPASERDSGAALFVRTGLIVGGVGLLVGAGAGIATLGEASDLESACTNGTCPPDQEDALSRANTLANVSNAGFAMAILGFGAAAAGHWLWPAPEPKTVTPTLGAGSIGLAGRF